MRQSNFGDRIRHLRSYTKLSRREFEEKYGIKETTLRSWELSLIENINMISKSLIQKLLNAFEQENIFCSEQWILYGQGEPPLFQEKHIESFDLIRTEITSEKDFIHIEKSLFLKHHPSAVFLEVTDDSMAPFFQKGDFIGATPLEKEKTLSIEPSGVPMVVYFRGQHIVRMVYNTGGDTYRAIGINPNVQSSPFVIENIQEGILKNILWHRNGK